MKKKCKICNKLMYIYEIDAEGKRQQIHELNEGTYLCHNCREKIRKSEVNGMFGKIKQGKVIK